MTAFGSPTNAVAIGGYGSFDGTMEGSFGRPRIVGTFTGERMQAFDVVWGSATGTAVIENSYVDVKDVAIRSGDSTIVTTGRFSLGYPRADRGEEINAIIRITRRPVADLRHSFELDDYDLDGLRAGARLGGLAQQALESRRGRSIVVVVFEFNDGEVEVRGQVGQGRREAMLRLDDGGEGGISG